MRTTVYNSVRASLSLEVAAYATDDTFNGNTVDLAEFLNNARSVGIVVVTGAVTDGSHAITLEHSDNDSDWDAVPASSLQGSLPTLDSDDDDVVYEFGYVPTKRYVRVVSTTTSTSSGGVYGALVLQGDVRREPVARA